MKSIQSKILLVVISGLLIMTVVVSAIVVSMTHGIMHKDADRILINVCEKEAAYINDVLGDIEKSAAVIEHYAVTEISELSELHDEMYRSEYLEKAKRMFVDVALNTHGLEGFFMRINPEYSDGTTGFYNLFTENDVIREMKVTDITQFEKDDMRNVGWYYIAVNAGEGVWLEPYVFPGYEKQLISYVLPIYVKDELLGVVGFDLDFEYLVERINEIHVYDRGYAVLLSRDETICYNMQDPEESQNPHTHAAAALKNGMYLELRVDYKDIQKDIRPMLRTIIQVFVVVLAISIVFTIIVTRKMIQPLKHLTHVAQRLSDGMKEEKLPVVLADSKDEIGMLSQVLMDTYGKMQEYTEYISVLAYRDSLTGVKNSTAYAESVNEINKNIDSDNLKFGVLVADINNLKQTNDKFGHDAGNELIIHAAKILIDIFKESDIFRIGGDEFAVILKNKDYDEYRTLLEQMDEACSKAYITVYEKRIAISIARGAALFHAGEDSAYRDVFTKADQAMYMNKEKIKQSLLKNA